MTSFFDVPDAFNFPRISFSDLADLKRGEQGVLSSSWAK
jgi:hypothetical protein